MIPAFHDYPLEQKKTQNAGTSCNYSFIETFCSPLLLVIQTVTTDTMGANYWLFTYK